MVMVERTVRLREARRAEARAYAALRQAFAGRHEDQVRQLASGGDAPCAAALQAGLEHGSDDLDTIREAIAQEVVVQTSRLQHNLMALGTIASTAPYIGLFGTVLGILDAFHTISVTGHTGASVVAGGISEALITTALGLGVAIPAVIAYNIFNGQVNALSLVVETHALDLASRLPVLGRGRNSSPGAEAAARNGAAKAGVVPPGISRVGGKGGGS
jgi:biopolymer transport protein ExbB